MSLAQRIKKGTVKVTKTNTPLAKVQDLTKYTGKAKPSVRKVIQIGIKKTPKKPTMKQFGDKGYKPSTGLGVGM